MRAMIRRLAGLVAVVVTAAGIAGAQETVNQATIAGRVLDPQGGAIPGAVVAARQTTTNVTVETTTGADGRFRFPYLRIGQYELRAHVQGFRDNVRTIALSAGSAFDLAITLEVAGVDSAVTVVAMRGSYGGSPVA